MRKVTIIIVFICIYSLRGQDKGDVYFIGFDYGIQMSGIKSEDFVASNYSSLIRINAGKWFNQKFGVNLSYQGRHFYAIADMDKHSYDYYSIEGLIDVKKLLFDLNEDSFYKLVLRGGFGLFKNYTYNEFNLHLNGGLQNLFCLSNHLSVKVDIGAIIGYDIYQGDQDILPNISIGVSYNILRNN